MAEEMKRLGNAQWFRGQTSNWPLLSGLGRLKDDERDDAIRRLSNFKGWIERISISKSIASDELSMMAIAQHYRIPTNLIDFTTDPHIAAFFACNEPTHKPVEGNFSCIICLNTDEFSRFCEMLEMQSELPDPIMVDVNVPELWRIQAQKGVFLLYPFGEDFEKKWYEFDRIIFPSVEKTEGMIPKEDVYPTQKSDLEILLDQYFMLEQMQEGRKNFDLLTEYSTITKYKIESSVDGIQWECFKPELFFEHSSWDNAQIKNWTELLPEDWTEISKAHLIVLDYPPNIEDPKRLRKLISEQLSIKFSQITGVRKLPLKWKLQNSPLSKSEEIERVEGAMAMLWDGLRRWPYLDNDIALGLATLVVSGVLIQQNPFSNHDVQIQAIIMDNCLGKAVEVEIALEDSTYSRGYANGDDLLAAVRKDFHETLTEEWRPKIENITQILQIAPSPRHVFDFYALNRLFATQIAPVQVNIRSETLRKARERMATQITPVQVNISCRKNARVYNLTRIIRLGLP
jgi:hypothetical protein